MLILRPTASFTLGDRQIVSCHVLRGDPLCALDRELIFYPSPETRRTIRITGISTAGEGDRTAYDLKYEGDPISGDELTDEAILADVEYQTAISESVELNRRG